MKYACTILLASIALVAAAFVNAEAAPGRGSQSAAQDSAIGKPIPGRYIVVLEDEQFAPPGLRRAAEHRRDVRDMADRIAFEYRGRRDQVYAEALNGFAIEAGPREAARLARDPRVALMTEDVEVEAAGAALVEQVAPPSWGLDRIDQRSSVLDSAYRWFEDDAAEVVHVYVLDSGIMSGHFDFDGRVDTINAFNAFLDGQGSEDCNGHGTHVAGTIAGTEHGVARNAVLHPVRVLNCSGRGSLSAVIAGVDWVTTQVIEQQHPAVANMSLATSPSLVLDNAIRASIAAGVTYVAAAGNSNTRACFFSPARIDEVITVGASDTNDVLASWSNFGDCVDLLAPGTSITSTFIGDNQATLTMSGSSMAAAHVTGIVASLLAQAPFASPAQLGESLLAHAGSIEDPTAADGTSPLAYSLIDVANDPTLGNGGLDFSVECNSRNLRCVFQASRQDERSAIVEYHWDFGDGQVHSQRRATARHGYRRSGISGSATVVLAAELEDGTLWIREKSIDLPF